MTGNVSKSSGKTRKDPQRRSFVAAAHGRIRGWQESFVTLACPFLQLCETFPALRRQRPGRRCVPCWPNAIALARAAVDVAALAGQLQDGGARSFVDSWRDLLGAIEAKSKAQRRTC
jgi:hypothetical protein